MAIERIERLTYGVADMAAGVRYFEDLGLKKLDAGASGAEFSTPTNQRVVLRRVDDPSLPRAPESGPTMRETTWGVDSKAALEALGAELSRDRDVKVDAEGTLHSHDVTGFAIAFAVSQPVDAEPAAQGYNQHRSSGRVNQRIPHRKTMTPTRIGHVVYLILPEGREEASAFYLDRLGFRLTDRSVRVGDFMRVGGTADHHSLLLMWIRQKLVRFDHAALELPGFDDVLSSGAHMSERGWKPVWGPGRQSLGSHVFWHFENPCGGEIEYFTDMDRFDESWPTTVWEQQTPGAPWMLGDVPEGFPARGSKPA
jgi:catechol 2,3-dioxygenase-like lactoylglutathione lyase family enzyme